MCRRYRIKEIDEQEINIISKTPFLYSELEIKVGDKAPCLLLSKDGLVLKDYTFGIPSFSDPLYNARSETITEKPSFAKSFQERRCLLPCEGFYEEDKYHHEHFFYSKEGTLYLLGIYQEEHFCILTGKPDQNVAYYHSRMPLFISKKDILTYLSKDASFLTLYWMDQPELSSPDISEQLSLF